jgi:hypothetical protein
MVKYQWRAKAYPRLHPTDEEGHGYDEGKYMWLVYDSLSNYCRKRKMVGPAAFIQRHIDHPNEWTIPFREKLAQLSRMFKMNLVGQYDDIISRRNMTLHDIDMFITYDTAINLRPEDLLIIDEQADVRDTRNLTREEMWDNFYSVSDSDDAETGSDDGILFDVEEGTGRQHGGDEDDEDKAGYVDQWRALLSSGQQFGLASVKKVDAMLWDYELQEAGYSLHWIDRLSRETGILIGEVVTHDTYLELLAKMKRMWRPRMTQNPALALQETADVS